MQIMQQYFVATIVLQTFGNVQWEQSFDQQKVLIGLPVNLELFCLNKKRFQEI